MKKQIKKKSDLGTRVGNASAKATGWPRGVNNVSLNRSGTVGTEPISKGGNRYTEVKAGRLGKIDIPMGKLKTKKMHKQQTRCKAHSRTMCKSCK